MHLIACTRNRSPDHITRISLPTCSQHDFFSYGSKKLRQVNLNHLSFAAGRLHYTASRQVSNCDGDSHRNFGMPTYLLFVFRLNNLKKDVLRTDGTKEVFDEFRTSILIGRIDGECRSSLCGARLDSQKCVLSLYKLWLREQF